MGKIVNINGRQYDISSEMDLSPDQEDYVINQLSAGFTAGCTTCGGNYEGLISLAPTCTSAPKTIGNVLTMASSPTNGTPPYTSVFWKIINGGDKKTITSPYIIPYTDYGVGQRYGVDVTDSCSTGAKTCTEECTITVSGHSTTMNTATKDWFANNAGVLSGSNMCYAASGIAYTTPDGPQTGSTGNVVTAFVAAHLVGIDNFIIIAGASYNTIKAMNGNVDLTLDDSAWATEQSGLIGTYCALVTCAAGPVCGAITVDGSSCSVQQPTGLHTLGVGVTGGQGALSHAWTVDGGSPQSGANPQYNFPTAKTYVIAVTVSDSCSPPKTCNASCNLTIVPGCATLSCGAITIDTLTCATTPPRNIVAGLHNLDITTTGGQGTLSYSWTINGVQGPTTKNPQIDFPVPGGGYDIRVDVKDSCTVPGQQSCYSTCHVEAVCTSPPSCTSGITVDGSPCAVQQQTGIHVLNINPTGGHGTLTYEWSVNGGSLQYVKSPPYSFPAAGTYTLAVTVSDSCTPAKQTCNASCNLTIVAGCGIPSCNFSLT